MGSFGDRFGIFLGLFWDLYIGIWYGFGAILVLFGAVWCGFWLFFGLVLVVIGFVGGIGSCCRGQGMTLVFGTLLYKGGLVYFWYLVLCAAVIDLQFWSSTPPCCKLNWSVLSCGS